MGAGTIKGTNVITLQNDCDSFLVIFHFSYERIFNAWTNHIHTWTHKTHHSPNLGEAITFPLIMFYVTCHEGYIQMAFSCDSQVGSLVIFKIGTSTTLDTYNFLCRPPIEVRPEAKLYPSSRIFP
jgi:hypothetical protein